jgi:hypothetical protein
LILKNK